MDTMNVPMQLREVDTRGRTITGIVAPYDEVSLFTESPSGERIMRHAFQRSIAHRGDAIPLCLNHDHTTAVGISREWKDDGACLVGVFQMRDTPLAEQAIRDVDDKVLQAMSVGFLPIDRGRGSDGVIEVREARLIEVSLVMAGAYDGARVLAARMARQSEALLAPFQNPPALPVAFIPPWA